MKCPNCGADYASRERYCPYCGTDNPKGQSWFRRRRAAEEEYRRTLEEAGVSLKLIAANRVANIALGAAVAVTVLTLIVIIGSILLGEGISEIKVSVNRETIESELAELYEQERYGELYRRLDETDLMGEDYYEYSQMALLYYEYSRFAEARIEFMSEKDGELDDYTVESLIGRANGIMWPYIPAYPELTPKNAAQMEEYQQDVYAFCRAVLGLTEDEMEIVGQEYLMSADEKAMAAAVIERRAWE